MAFVFEDAGGRISLLFFFCGIILVNGEVLNRLEKPPLFDFGLSHGDKKIKVVDFTADTVIDLEEKNVTYFGAKYNKLHISVDGLIAFDEGMKYYKGIKWSEGTRNKNTDKPFIAPFLYDGFKAINVNPNDYKGSIFYRVIEADKLKRGSQNFFEQDELLNELPNYIAEATLHPSLNFEAHVVVIVTWENVLSEASGSSEVNRCAQRPDECKSATFQAVLVSDVNLGKTIAVFNYLRMNIDNEDDYQAGFNGGYGRDWFNVIPCHGRCARGQDSKDFLNSLPTLKGSDVQGRFIVDVSEEVVVRGGCLPEALPQGVFEVAPREVGMFGGEKLEVSGQCLSANTPIFCRFGAPGEGGVIVEGKMINSMKGYCPVPTLTMKGPIVLSWSTDRYAENWNIDRTIDIVLPGRLSPPVAVAKSVKDAWLSRDAEQITVPWDATRFTYGGTGRVEISLIGYREFGSQVEYKKLETLGKAAVSEGHFKFRVEDHRCKRNCKDFEIGLLEVKLLPEYLPSAKDFIAVRHGEIPLGWYVNERLTEDNGTDWSNNMCKVWHEEDGKQTDWLASLLPCPCSVDQALSDFGRFQPDPGCNLFTGSVCTYHIGAKHCVRSVVPTAEGSGNQCCYNGDGNLVWSQLSYQGSTPDRGHSWGSEPYRKADLVPSLSHWKHDVVSFYYCCLWNEYDLCDLYMERRPTQDCKNYEVPGIASLRGVSHVTTADNNQYQMIGVGDFYLLKLDDLIVQGRFGDRRHAWDLGSLSGRQQIFSAPVLTDIGMMWGSTPVEFHLAPENSGRGIDIRVNLVRTFFNTQATMWQDFNGFSITNNVHGGENHHNNFTVLFKNNIGINIVSQNGLLHITVALPPTLKRPAGQTYGMGLLGVYDNSPDNDFTAPDESLVSPGSPQSRMIDNFIMKWKVEGARDSAFSFFEAARKVPPGFEFDSYTKIPKMFTGSPTEGNVDSVCGEDELCKYDYYITGSENVAVSTRDANELLHYTKQSTKPSDNCGLPDVGRNAIMDSYDFSVNSEITVTGCGDGMSFAGSETYTCTRELRSEARKAERADYGISRTDPNDGLEYLTHWLPRPSRICSEGSGSAGLSLPIIIGIIVAAVILLIVIIVIVVICVRKRNSESHSPNKRSSSRDDTKAGQPMLGVDRSPVYKPSRDPVQMQGSSV